MTTILAELVIGSWAVSVPAGMIIRTLRRAR